MSTAYDPYGLPTADEAPRVEPSPDPADHDDTDGAVEP